MFASLTRWAGLFVLPGLLSAALVGCIKREEAITVAPDGGVTVTARFEADSLHELEGGDAFPTAAGGWQVDREVTKQDDGKEEHLLVATQHFPPGSNLPQTYADPGDPDAGLYLHFPTTLTIEKRPDGVYYHFHREYPARLNWVELTQVGERILEEPQKQLRDKAQEDWTQDDWQALVGALVDVELAKMTAFSREAFMDALPQAPQDHWLYVRTALHNAADGIQRERVAALLMNAKNGETGPALETEAETFEAQALERMAAALEQKCGYAEAQAAEFTDRYSWYKRHYEISEDLSDESFEITVEMPGEIVAADAGKIEGSRAMWEFDAKSIRDGGVELRVTSRVPR